MRHDTHPTLPTHTHTHTTPNLGGCEEDLSKKTLPDGTNILTDGHGNSMTDPAQRAKSVKMGAFGLERNCISLNEFPFVFSKKEICNVEADVVEMAVLTVFDIFALLTIFAVLSELAVLFVLTVLVVLGVWDYWLN